MADLEISAPFPYLPPKSTKSLLSNFDERVFNVNEGSHIYNLVDALAGKAGAASLQRELLIRRMAAQPESIYFEDLDRIFGVLFSIHRLDYESYPYNPYSDLLTSDQWDEVRTKDAWYRARAVEFLEACSYGGTVEGFQKMVHSLLGVDSDVYEIWKYLNNPTILGQLGRTEYEFYNEIVVAPHVTHIDEKTTDILLHFLDRIKPVDSIVTIDINGLAVHNEIQPRSVTSDSVYFEIQKTVTGVPNLAEISAPEYIISDVFQNDKWLKPGQAVEQPTTAFASTQEHSYVYTLGNGGQISTVGYYSSKGGSPRKVQDPYVETKTTEGQTQTFMFPAADAPDVYPGGRYGIHPTYAPALNPDKSKYVFPYNSQKEANDAVLASLKASGVDVISQTNDRYTIAESWGTTVRYPVLGNYALANQERVKSSDITTSWFASREPAMGTKKGQVSS